MMKPMAGLAILVGALEEINVIREFTAGESGFLEGLLLAIVSLAAIALMASGVALLVRARGAERLASAGAVACIITFAGIAAFSHVLSMAASLLGVGFPIALLVVQHRNTSKSSAAATR